MTVVQSTCVSLGKRHYTCPDRIHVQRDGCPPTRLRRHRVALDALDRGSAQCVRAAATDLRARRRRSPTRDIHQAAFAGHVSGAADFPMDDITVEPARRAEASSIRSTNQAPAFAPLEIPTTSPPNSSPAARHDVQSDDRIRPWRIERRWQSSTPWRGFSAVATTPRWPTSPMRRASVGRATLDRYFPTRQSLLRGVAHTETAELADGIEAANLDELAVDRAIGRLTAVFRRTGGHVLHSQLDEYHDPAEKERVIKPVRADFFRSK